MVEPKICLLFVIVAKTIRGIKREKHKKSGERTILEGMKLIHEQHDRNGLVN